MSFKQIYKKLYKKEKEKNEILEEELNKLKLEIKKINECSLVRQSLIGDNIHKKQCSNDYEFWQGLTILDLE